MQKLLDPHFLHLVDLVLFNLPLTISYNGILRDMCKCFAVIGLHPHHTVLQLKIRLRERSQETGGVYAGRFRSGRRCSWYSASCRLMGGPIPRSMHFTSERAEQLR